MKHPLFLFLLLILAPYVQAQDGKKDFMYFSSSLSAGNYFGGEMALNYIHNEKTSFKIGFTGHLRFASSTPDDFSEGFLGALLFGAATPWDKMVTYQLCMGKIFPLTKSGTIRANISLGLGYSVMEVPRNWGRGTGSWLAPNYHWDYEQYGTMSLIINPSFEFAFFRFYGLSISPMVLINKDTTFVGLGFGHMIGLLRNRKNRS